MGCAFNDQVITRGCDAKKEPENQRCEQHGEYGAKEDLPGDFTAKNEFAADEGDEKKLDSQVAKNGEP